MIDPKRFFHLLSYLQYPIMLFSLWYAFKPFFFGFETVWADLNKVLVCMGLGISFSTLQDTTKTQNKMSKKVWANPRHARLFLIYMFILTMIMIGFGVWGFFFTLHEKLQEIALGAIAVGISFIGLLKTAVEMADYQQKAKLAKDAEN